MKLNFKLSKHAITELEGTQVEIFEQLSNIQDVFGNARCGKCQCEDLKYVVREVDENKYYEIRCTNCFAKLQVGQHKKGGTLFAKRQEVNEDGERSWYPDQGWVKYNKESGKME